MIRTLLVLLCLTKSSIRKLQRWHPSLLWGTIKAFASENIKKKKWPPFLQSSRVCASTSVFGLYLLPALLLMFFEVISHPDFFHQDLVFSHPPIYLLSSYFLFKLIWVNRESLLSRMIANLSTHLSLKKMSFQCHFSFN